MKNFSTLILMIVIGMMGVGCVTEGELEPNEDLEGRIADLEELLYGDDGLEELLNDLDDDMEHLLTQSSFATYHDVNSSVEGCSVLYGDEELWYAKTGIEVLTPCIILIDSGDENSSWTITQFSEFDNCGEAYGFTEQVFIVAGELQIQAGYHNTDPFWDMMKVAIIPLADSNQ